MASYNGADKRLEYLFQNGGGGGGGTTVVANPAGQATDILNKLQVGQTIYDVAGGAGGVIYDTIYEASTYSASAGTASVTKQYTLSKSIELFDAVIVAGWCFNDGSIQTMLDSTFIPKTDFYDRPIDHGVAGTNPFFLNASFGGNRRQLAFQFDDATHITTVALRTEAGIEPILYKIIGISFGGDGGHIYSTDEQVVGKWIDGSTLYERTFKPTTSMSIPVNGTWYNTNININYVNKIVEATVGNDTWVMGVFSVFKNSNLLYITSGGAMGSNTLSVNRITIRYTKS